MRMGEGEREKRGVIRDGSKKEMQKSSKKRENMNVSEEKVENQEGREKWRMRNIGKTVEKVVVDRKYRREVEKGVKVG